MNKRRYAPQKPKVKSVEIKTQNLDFALQRFNILKEDIIEYKTQQAQLKDEDLKLLKFISIAESSNEQAEGEEQETTEESDQGLNKKELERKLNTIKQQFDLITKIKSKVEAELHLNQADLSGMTDEQKEQLQTKTLQEQQIKYKDLVLDMNYQMDLENPRVRRNRQPRGEYRSHQSQNKWFEIQDENLSMTIYSHSKQQYYHWISDLANESKVIDNFNVNISSLETETDFFKFDDFIQTVKLTNSNFKQVSITVTLDNILCILAALKILMSLKSFNLLSLSIYQGYRTEIKYEDYSDIISAFFEIVFSHRHLQSLSLSISDKFFSDMVKSFSKIDTKHSQLKVLTYAGSLQLANTDCVTNYFQFLSQLPQLYHLQQSQTPISGRNCSEAINSLFKNIKSLHFSFVSIPNSFNFEFNLVQLLYLNFEINVEINVLTLDKMENLLLSIKEAKQLKNLRLTLNQVSHQADTSRKEILRQAQAAKNAKNKQIESQETQETQETQIQDNNETTPILKKEKYLLFDNLSDLVNLEDVSINVPKNQDLYDSLHKLLMRSSSLIFFKLNLVSFDSCSKFNQNIDFKNILETLNTLKKCRKAELNGGYVQIKYELPNKDSSFYTLTLNTGTDNQSLLLSYNPFKFTFDRVNSINITQHINNHLNSLNTLCQSLSTTKNLNTLTLNIKTQKQIENLLCTNQAIFPKLPFFSQLSTLKNLEHLNMDLVFDQHILNTIAQFIEQSKMIKSFIIRRKQYNQYYLNFTNLFKALSQSTSLQQLYTSFFIEQLKVTHESYKETWENQKQKNYFNPYCELIKNSSSNLDNLDLDEVCSEKFLMQILQSLLDSSHHRYMKLNYTNEQRLIGSESEELQELLKLCSNKGCLVKSSYQFPLQIPINNGRRERYR